MTDLQTINIGSAPDDGTGDPLRTAFDKINDNFAELNAGTTFTTTYKGSCPYMRDYVGLHDASWGRPRPWIATASVLRRVMRRGATSP